MRLASRLPATLAATALLAVAWLAGPVPAAMALTVTGRCVGVHDGDTITIETPTGREKIRLVGIDAPEVAQEPWGPRAGAFTRGLALGKDVRVETDVQPRDRYGRLLGYVYVGDTFVNLQVIKSGHAVLLTYPPNVAHVEEFTAAQAAARQAGLGIWDPKAPLDRTPYQFRHPDAGRSPSAGASTGASTGTSAPEAEVQSLSPDTEVRYNKRSKKIHRPGCGHPCASCKTMTFAEAKQLGGQLCKPSRSHH